MSKFRKKPVVVDARQFTLDTAKEVSDWCNGVLTDFSPHLFITIKTLEGNMKANLNDWIIKGIKNEFYPCKPDIFDDTYEAVT